MSKHAAAGEDDAPDSKKQKLDGAVEPESPSSATRKFIDFFTQPRTWKYLTVFNFESELAAFGPILHLVEFGSAVDFEHTVITYLIQLFQETRSSDLSVCCSLGRVNFTDACLTYTARQLDSYTGSLVALFSRAAALRAPTTETGFGLFDSLFARGVSIDTKLATDLHPPALVLWAFGTKTVPACLGLLSRGADIDATDDEGKTIVTRCIRDRNTHLLLALSDAGWLAIADMTTPRMRVSGRVESDEQLADSNPTHGSWIHAQSEANKRIIREAIQLHKTTIRPQIRAWLVDECVTPLIPDLADIVMQYIH